MGRSGRMKASEYGVWTSLESLCEAAAAVKDGGGRMAGCGPSGEERATGEAGVGDGPTPDLTGQPAAPADGAVVDVEPVDYGTALDARAPPPQPGPEAGCPSAREVEAFASVHDMIHSAVAAHGRRATLREIYSECRKRGRIAYRRSTGSRLITQNDHWKSQIRHALYTSSRFFRTAEDSDYWSVSEPYAAKGFRMTTVTLPCETEEPQAQEHRAIVLARGAAPCEADRRGPANVRPTRLGNASGKRKQRTESCSTIDLAWGLEARRDPHENPSELHHTQPYSTSSAIANTLRQVCMAHGLENEAPEAHHSSLRNLFCPLLGVEVPRKLRTGIARSSRSSVSTATLALSCNSDDDSAFGDPQPQAQPQQVEEVPHPSVPRLSTMGRRESAKTKRRHSTGDLERPAAKRSKVNEHSENDAVPPVAKTKALEGAQVCLPGRQPSQPQPLVPMPLTSHQSSSLINHAQPPPSLGSVFPGVSPELMSSPLHAMISSLPAPHTQHILQLLWALKTATEDAFGGPQMGTQRAALAGNSGDQDDSHLPSA